MDTLLHDLVGFYKKLDQALEPSKRACGICGECCRKASRLRVYPLELQNIRRSVNDEYSIRKFLDFSNNKVVKIWGDIEGQCPFLDGDHCTVYDVRPYFCRVYGHYNFRGDNLLKGCVYCGHSTIYFDRKELPLYDDFLSLVESKHQLVKC